MRPPRRFLFRGLLALALLTVAAAWALPGRAGPGSADPLPRLEGVSTAGGKVQAPMAARPGEGPGTAAEAGHGDPGAEAPQDAVETLESGAGGPDHGAIRGLYVNAWAAGSAARMDTLLAIADSTEINALVIDIKDATGYVSHASAVPEVVAAGATGQIRIRDLPGLLARLEAAGLHPIARIVVAKDPVLTAARPDWAIRDTAGGVWRDARENAWLNLWVDEVRTYHTALAREVAALGFREIQWDYIRFPDAPAEIRNSARFPGARGRQAAAVERFLAEAREELADTGVRMSADVFGVTTSARHDVGVGQVWDGFVDDVDVALPMIYPSHFHPGSHGVARPADHPYEVVRSALEAAVARNREIPGAGAVVPWLQDFSWGRGTVPYGPAEVRAQIQATYDAGLEGWILWNSGSSYTVEALEPARGWAREPGIRVGGQVVPVSRRGEVLQEVTPAAPPAGTAPRPARSGPAGSRPDGPA